MNLPIVQREMQEDHSLWSLYPVQDIDTVLTCRHVDANNTVSLLCCDLYLRQFKESLKQTMLDQESVFEDQIHELHRLYQRQKDLMMEMGEINDLCSQPRHLLLNAGDSSPRTSIHWMNLSVSTSKASVLPQEDASAKIEDENDKYGEKVLVLELPSYGDLDIGEEEKEGSKNGEVHDFPKDQSPRRMSRESAVQPETVQHVTGLSRSECILDLNEPAKIELNQFLSPAQTRSERSESETQDRHISTQSQVENGINLNVSPLSSEEVATFKKIESEQPREFLAVSLYEKHRSGPARGTVLALPCATDISLFHKRSSWPRKKGKRGAKSPTVQTFPRSKARKGSNLDSSFGVNDDDNHSLSTASYIPESDHNQEHLTRNWTNTGKRRHRKPGIESGKVMRKIARTKSKTRGSSLVTVDMSLSDSTDCINSLHWFARIASSVVEDTKSEIGLSLTGFHSDYQTDYFEAMTLQLTDMTQKEQRTNTSVSNIVSAKHKRTLRSQGKRQQQHNKENLPSVRSFIGKEVSHDLQKIEMLIEASETNDAHSSLMENTVIDWGIIRKRRRGIRSPATNTKNSIAFLQLPF